MSKFILQYPVYVGKPLTKEEVTVEVFNSSDSSDASLWEDFEGISPIVGNTVAISNGELKVYTNPGLYDIRAYDSEDNERWFRNVEVGEFQTLNDKHVLKFQILSGNNIRPTNVYVKVKNSSDSSDANVWDNSDGTGLIEGSEFFVTDGFFEKYVDPGKYNLIVTELSGNQTVLNDIEIGEWSSDNAHSFHGQVFGGDPLTPLLEGITVRVKNSEDDTDATIYLNSDASLEKNNPFSVKNAKYDFYATPGRYDIEVYENGDLIQELEDVYLGEWGAVCIPPEAFGDELFCSFTGYIGVGLKTYPTTFDSLVSEPALIDVDPDQYWIDGEMSANGLLGVTVLYNEVEGSEEFLFVLTSRNSVTDDFVTESTQENFGDLGQIDSVSITRAGTFAANIYYITSVDQSHVRIYPISGTTLGAPTAIILPGQTNFGSISFSNSGIYFAVAGFNITADVWQLQIRLTASPSTLVGSVTLPDSTSITGSKYGHIVWSPDDNKITVDGLQNGRQVWFLDTTDKSNITVYNDVFSVNPIGEVPSAIAASVFSPDGTYLAIVGIDAVFEGDQGIFVYDTSDYTTPINIELPNPLFYNYMSASNAFFTPDGEHFVILGNDDVNSFDIHILVYKVSDWSIHYIGTDNQYGPFLQQLSLIYYPFTKTVRLFSSE